MRSLALAALSLMLTGIGASCGASALRLPTVDPLASETRHAAGLGPLRLSWTREIDVFGDEAYHPAQRGVPALDATHNRVYVTSVKGYLWALNGAGGKLYRYPAQAHVESEPLLDPTGKELYFGDENGVLHALHAADGTLRWRAAIGGSIRKAPLLYKDTLYVVTETDRVVALDRKNGERLWRYEGERAHEMSLVGHGGLVIVPAGYLLVTLTNGSVMALNLGDGHVQWEFDTTEDVEDFTYGTPRFIDVDTTPLIVENKVYIASVASGLYALDVENGNLLWRNSALLGVSAIAYAQDRLIVSSAVFGIVCFVESDKRLLWAHPIERGVGTAPVIANQAVLVGETEGGFIALSLETGHEINRIESGSGFSAPAAVLGNRAYVLSNGGLLYAFHF